MKTIIFYLPYVPLYLITLIALVWILKALFCALFPPKVKSNDLATIEQDKENQEIYKLFS